MSQRYTCQECGESSTLEVLRFLDEAGRARIRLTCTLFVHVAPVVEEFNDPTVTRAAELTPVDGLVHDLDLYNKLEAIVLALDGRYEYGVVEHLFAAEHPEDYAELWQRFGHVATHGSKQYTLSSYLAKLLGTLARHGAITYLPFHGTGRWRYDADISAWANPARAAGPITSWAEYASRVGQGWGKDDWPATAPFPTDELPGPTTNCA